MNFNKKNVLSGLFWMFSERMGAQIVTFIVSLVLARILMPDDYGIVSLALIFINFCDVIATTGLSSSLVQDENVCQKDFSTAFYFNLIFSVILYVIVYVCAPLIASFFKNDQLTIVLRVFALRIPIGALNSVQRAFVSRNMLFKKFFFSTLFGTITAGVIGVFLALNGYGVWALVAQYLTNSIIDSIVLFITVKWRPTLEFSVISLKRMYSFGAKILVASLLHEIYMEFRTLIIGKKYTSKDLAYFKQGEQFPKVIVQNINSSITNVLFPALSIIQTDKSSVKKMVQKSIQTSTYIMFPLMIGLAIMGESAVEIILTEKWLPCVPFLWAFCISYSLEPLQTANLQAIKAMGRSDLVLKMEIIKKTFGILTVIITVPISVEAIAVGNIVSTIFANVVNAAPNKKLLNYGYLDQIKDISGALILAGIMGIVVYLVGLININIYVKILMQIISGIISYLILSKIFKIQIFYFLLDTVKSFVGGKSR